MANVSADDQVVKRLTKRLADGVPAALGDLMRQAHQRLVSILDDALLAAGWDDVRSAHVSVLATIDPGGSRLTTLTERGGRSKQAVAELVSHLVAQGYLDAHADPSDGRAKLFHPTPRTFALLATCERVVDDYGRWLDTIVGRDTVNQMRHTLQTIIDAPA